MHALRAVRVLVPLAIILAIVAAVTSVLSARPDLQHARKGVAAAWTPLGKQLEGRYLKLTAADREVEPLSGPVHDLAVQVNRALADWQAAHTRGDLTAQVRAANTLESLARRLVTTAQQSPRVEQNADAKAAVDAFAADASVGATTAFNAAVEKYERERRGPLRSVVAAVLGEGNIPAFAPAVSA